MTSSEDRGKEVDEALQWGADRMTLTMIRQMTEGLDIPPGTIITLARDLHRAWPGRPDADRMRSMEAHIARATARYPLARPQQARPPAPGPATLPPGSVPGLGFGKASDRANSYHRVYQDLAASRGSVSMGCSGVPGCSSLF